MLARFTGGGVFRRALGPRVALHSALRRSTAASPDGSHGRAATDIVVSHTLCRSANAVKRPGTRSGLGRVINPPRPFRLRAPPGNDVELLRKRHPLGMLPALMPQQPEFRDS